ncbi:MAG: S8 family serine peptidase [Vicinamibacterales bacterium]
MLFRQLAPGAALAAALTLGPVSGAAAQDAAPAPAYRLLSSAEHILALVKAADDKLPYVPGEVLVKFRDGLTPIDQQRALSALRSRPGVGSLEWTGDVAILRDSSEPDAALLAERLSQQPEVEYAEPNALYRHTTTPNDPSFTSRQWNFTAIGVDRAWDINPGASKNVIVAVVDYGITTVTNNYTFATWDGRAITGTSVAYRVNPDLSASRLLDGRDFAFWGGPVLDMDGHGTHVSSTIGEDTNNGVAEAGIAYNATILPLKACLGYWDVQFTLSALGIRGYAPADAGGCTASAIASAIRYAADNGAAVINLSLGGPGTSTTIRDAMTYAVQHGSLVAVAMGNEYEEGNPTDYPAGYAGQIDGVIAVGAVGRSLKRAYYSNTGPHNELAAPGGDVRDGGVAGTIWQAGLNPSDYDPHSVIFPRFDRYVELPEQGTSMATPHVAGVAALVYSQGVKDPAAIEKLLEATAQDLGATGRDNEFGYGLIQPRAALRGFGIAR